MAYSQGSKSTYSTKQTKGSERTCPTKQTKGSERTYSTKQTKNEPASRQVRWKSVHPSDEESDSESADSITQRAYAPQQTELFPAALIGLAASKLLPPVAAAVFDLVEGWVAPDDEKSPQQNTASSKQPLQQPTSTPGYSYAVPGQFYPNPPIFASRETFQYPQGSYQPGQFYYGSQKTVPGPVLYQIQTPHGQSQNPSYRYSQYQPQILPGQVSTEPPGRGLYQPQKPPLQGQTDQYRYPQGPYQLGQPSPGTQKTVSGPGLYQPQTPPGQNQNPAYRYSQYQTQTLPGQVSTEPPGRGLYQQQKPPIQGQTDQYKYPQGQGQNPNYSYRYSMYQAQNSPGQIYPGPQKPAQGPNQMQTSSGQGQTAQQANTQLGIQDLRNTQDSYQPQNNPASRQVPSGPPKPRRASSDQQPYQQQNFTGEGRAAGAGYSQGPYQPQSPTQYNTMASANFQLENPSRQGQNITSGYQMSKYQPETSYGQMKSVPGPQYNSSQTPSMYQSTTAYSQPISPPPGTRFSMPGGSPPIRSSFKDTSYQRQNENRTGTRNDMRTYSRRV